jgi:hypothetical protein
LEKSTVHKCKQSEIAICDLDSKYGLSAKTLKKLKPEHDVA